MKLAINWTFNREFSFKKNRLSQIYRFYVIETPVYGTSIRGKTFKEYGINMISLNAAMKRETPFLKEKWITANARDIQKCCIENGIWGNADLTSEVVIHTINSKHCNGKTDSLFYAIRCAFAHGAFDIHKYKNETYYILENRDGEVVKGRMIIKESTLVKWIEIVKAIPIPKKVKR